jgi:hypothetical protein
MDRCLLLTWIGGFALGCSSLLWVQSYLYPSPMPIWRSDRAHEWIASNHGRVSFAYISDRAFMSGRNPYRYRFLKIGSLNSFWRYQLPEYWEEDVVTFIGGIDRGFRTTGVAIPYWILTILSAAPLVVGIRRMQSRKVHTGLCRRCGYDLRASPLRCPECGTPIPSDGQPRADAETMSAS